jgi:hypothetical protein
MSIVRQLRFEISNFKFEITGTQCTGVVYGESVCSMQRVSGLRRAVSFRSGLEGMGR